VVEDLLGSLVDKSLLTTTRGPLGTRFRQLETLRQYGEERVEVRAKPSARGVITAPTTWRGQKPATPASEALTSCTGTRPT
jgi:hypothetical protein